jgi:D-arabinose 1-dehydrogenase-like Zn-dependent alcohol dehydrogenase
MEEGRAIVAHTPLNQGDWKLEPIKVGAVGDHELLVRMVGSGICHTDLSVGGYPAGVMGITYPWVLGHEGM